jgi:hypothetical protein
MTRSHSGAGWFLWWLAMRVKSDAAQWKYAGSRPKAGAGAVEHRLGDRRCGVCAGMNFVFTASAG